MKERDVAAYLTKRVGEMAAEALKVILGGVAAFASMLAMIWVWLAL